MMRSRWRTPIFQVETTRTTTAAKSTLPQLSQQQVVEVPQDGWYAFCFGCGDEDVQDNERKKAMKSNSVVSMVSSSSSSSTRPPVVLATLCIQPPRAPEEDEGSSCDDAPLNDGETGSGGKTLSTTIRLDLPLSISNGWLRNLDVGKQIFLTKGSKLSVSSASATAEASTSSSESDCTNRQTILQWCILFYHSLRQEASATTARMDSILVAAGERPDVGTLSNHRKNLVCRHCVRSFPSLHAVVNHIDFVHKKISSSSSSSSNSSNTNKHARKKQRRNGENSDDVEDDEREDDDIAKGHSCSHDKDIWTRPLTVIYEDDFLAVIDKPQGMPVMGTKPSLIRCDLLLPLRSKHCASSNNCKKNSSDAGNNNSLPQGDAALGKPRPVHRLDAATGGVLVVAKTRRAEATLKTSFEQRQCHKRYRAIVLGKLTLPTEENNTAVDDEGRGVFDSPISGKASRSLYRPVQHVRSVRVEGWLTLVDLWPVTGRRHQLRKHMKEIGHPVLGDSRHSGKSKQKMIEEAERESSVEITRTRLCLWAVEITVPHPHTGDEKSFRLSQDPFWMERVLQLEEAAWREQAGVNNL